jgi:hypothetical protein
VGALEQPNDFLHSRERLAAVLGHEHPRRKRVELLFKPGLGRVQLLPLGALSAQLVVGD